MYSKIFIKRNKVDNRIILFEVTKKCNLSCTYCINNDFYNRSKVYEDINLKFIKAKKLIDHLVKIWNSDKNSSLNEEIRIGFYGGEPLLNFELIEKIVNYSKSIKLRFNSFRFNMTTNGTLLDKHMDFLVKNDFNIMISLDGNKECNLYRTFKNGKKSFKSVNKNLKKLEKKYPEFFKNNVIFNAVLHNNNSVESIYNYFKNEFNKKPRISEIDRTGIRECKTECFNFIYNNIEESIELASDKSEIEREMIFYSPRGYRLIKHLYYNSELFFKSHSSLQNINTKKKPTGSCIPLQKKIFLDCEGNIFPCERVGKEHKMGRVTVKSVEIWYEKIAEKYNRYFNVLKNQCSKCYNINTCPNCILKMEPAKEGFKCKYWIGKEQYEKRFKQILDFLRENRDLYRKIAEEIFLE